MSPTHKVRVKTLQGMVCTSKQVRFKVACDTEIPQKFPFGARGPGGGVRGMGGGGQNTSRGTKSEPKP